MKKLFAVSISVLTLLLAVGCGSGDPTIAANPQTSEEISQAAVDLFQDWFNATEQHNPTAVHGLLSSNIRDRCTVEQMETFFETDTTALTYPEMGVEEVFLAAGNAGKAFVTMALLGEPKSGQQGLWDNYVSNIPYQIVKEDGRWRLVIEMLIVDEGCPFVGSFSREEAQPSEDSTPISP